VPVDVREIGQICQDYELALERLHESVSEGERRERWQEADRLYTRLVGLLPPPPEPLKEL
jgi:hypothetical protein